MWGAHKPKLLGVQHRNPIYLVTWTLDDQNLIREDKHLNYRPIKLQTEIMWIIWNWNSWRTNRQSESQQIPNCPWQVDIYLCNQAKYKYFSGLDSSMIHSKVNQAWARKNLTQWPNLKVTCNMLFSTLGRFMVQKKCNLCISTPQPIKINK